MAVSDILTEKKYVKIGDSCVDDPCYLQWLNRYGGSSYWLFGVLNVDKATTKEIGYYERFVSDLETSQGNDGIISKSKELTKIVGATIPKDQMDGLTGLFCSPKVKMLVGQYWQVEGVKWHDVRIKSGSMVINQTRKDFFDVSFEIILPKQYVISE